MIVRLWHGKVDASKADESEVFMKERAAPDYCSVGGLEKLYFLRRIEKSQCILVQRYSVIDDFF